MSKFWLPTSESSWAHFYSCWSSGSTKSSYAVPSFQSAPWQTFTDLYVKAVCLLSETPSHKSSGCNFCMVSCSSFGWELAKLSGTNEPSYKPVPHISRNSCFNSNWLTYSLGSKNCLQVEKTRNSWCCDRMCQNLPGPCRSLVWRWLLLCVSETLHKLKTSHWQTEQLW